MRFRSGRHCTHIPLLHFSYEFVRFRPGLNGIPLVQLHVYARRRPTYTYPLAPASEFRWFWLVRIIPLKQKKKLPFNGWANRSSVVGPGYAYRSVFKTSLWLDHAIQSAEATSSDFQMLTAENGVAVANDVISCLVARRDTVYDQSRSRSVPVQVGPVKAIIGKVR
jgi:hypothetical protein